jgi:hypothetical protein
MSSFVEMARDDVTETMNRWNKLHHHPAIRPTSAEVEEIITKLVGCNISLLRAIEEVEARPWWRRRRFNPYAR